MTNILKCWGSDFFKSLSLVAFVLLFVSSCDDPDNFSFKTERNVNRYTIETIDTLPVLLRTVREDSLRSDEFSLDLIGSYRDPVVGSITASVFTELRLPKKLITYGTNRVLDSLVLYLKYAGSSNYFGWLEDDITLNVYELDQRIYLDSAYYSTTKIKYNPVKLGTWKGCPRPNARKTIAIKLDPSLGNRILNASNEQLGDDIKFKEVLKGLAIIPEKTTATGSIISFKLQNDSSGLVLYFHNSDDTLSSTFQINDKCARVSHFEHDFTATPIAEQLQNASTYYSQVFLKPLSGVKAQIDLPSLAGLVKDGPIAVHRAEIIFHPAKTPPYSDFTIPSMILLLSDSANKNYSMVDRYETYYGGKLDNNTGSYSFVVTRYVQDLVNQYLKDSLFVSKYRLNLIIPSDNPILAVPLILSNLNNQGKAMTSFKIYYSRLN
ncbi:MAG: DUF4270 domain-containing protein [Sphingobacteriales bacterium]|nr:DUF4270 domain-containing protein [Sphingobacteriales bacterium]